MADEEDPSILESFIILILLHRQPVYKINFAYKTAASAVMVVL